ncbi:hypothetical protein L4D06_03255 [Enterovibrio makurazakiensis]
MKSVYTFGSADDNEEERIALNFAYNNWKVYKSSPEAYLKLLWSRESNADLNRFKY